MSCCCCCCWVDKPVFFKIFQSIASLKFIWPFFVDDWKIIYSSHFDAVSIIVVVAVVVVVDISEVDLLHFYSASSKNFLSRKPKLNFGHEFLNYAVRWLFNVIRFRTVGYYDQKWSYITFLNDSVYDISNNKTTKNFQTHITSFCSTNERMEDAPDRIKGGSKNHSSNSSNNNSNNNKEKKNSGIPLKFSNGIRDVCASVLLLLLMLFWLSRNVFPYFNFFQAFLLSIMFAFEWFLRVKKIKQKKV